MEALAAHTLQQPLGIFPMRKLTLLGVPGKQVTTVSYGSEKPKAPGHDEEAWAENRRERYRLHWHRGALSQWRENFATSQSSLRELMRGGQSHTHSLVRDL